jgi:hypothetical protein
MVKAGKVYQARIPEIGRTLIEYTKSDGTYMIIVVWDSAFYKDSSTATEYGDLSYLATKGNPVGFTVIDENDGQAIRAWAA